MFSSSTVVDFLQIPSSIVQHLKEVSEKRALEETAERIMTNSDICGKNNQHFSRHLFMLLLALSDKKLYFTVQNSIQSYWYSMVNIIKAHNRVFKHSIRHKKALEHATYSTHFHFYFHF